MFRNPPEVNYRAVRDMGLAAWFGSSLMGLGVLGHAIPDAIPETRERLRVVDAGWKGTRGLTAGAAATYVIGVGLVRFEGKPFQDGMPRWLTEGPESPLRAALTATALGAAVGAKRAREKGLRELEQRPATTGTVVTTEEPPEVARRIRTSRILRGLVAACTGALMYSHIKEEAQKRSKVTARFGRR